MGFMPAGGSDPAAEEGEVPPLPLLLLSDLEDDVAYYGVLDHLEPGEPVRRPG
jgi:hypothetical protein